MMDKEMSFSFFIPQKKSAEAPAQEGLQSEFEKVDSTKKYKIIGVVEREDNLVYINSASLSDLNIDRFSQVKVKCKTTQGMGLVRDRILEYGLLVSSLSDTVDQANQIFSVVRFILMLFGGIALVVSAIGMFNTMTITLLERTEEIGIMKAIGASDSAVSTMFFLESAVMGFLGGLSGVVMGWLGGRAFNMVINFIAVKFGGEQVNLFTTPIWLVLGVIGTSAVVGFLTGLVPARRASKTDPLDALRYK